MSRQTYFIRFDGNLLFYDDRPFRIERVFDTGCRHDIFAELFDDESGWDQLQDMFEDEFDEGKQVLDCPIGINLKFSQSSKSEKSEVEVEERDTYDDVATFVRHYVVKGADKFFSDVDRTWVTHSANACAFVRSDEADKLLTIMKTCSNGDGIEDYNTGHLDPKKYYKKSKKRKRSKSK
jgi:hypothetical protein